MMAMAPMCPTRVRYIRLLIHLVVGVEEGGESSGRCSHGVVDLIQSTHVTVLVLENLDQFND
jgi:hypothetical protein